MESIRPLAQNIQEQVDLAPRLFFDGLQTNGPRPICLAAGSFAGADCRRSSIVEDAETASLHERENVATAEAKRGIGGKNTIGNQAWQIIGGVDWIFRQDHAAPGSS